MNTFELTCDCGNKIVTDRKKDWCTKCGKPVFRDPKDKRQYKINQLYILGILMIVITSVVYFFLELIVTPMFE